MACACNVKYLNNISQRLFPSYLALIPSSLFFPPSANSYLGTRVTALGARLPSPEEQGKILSNVTGSFVIFVASECCRELQVPPKFLSTELNLSRDFHTLFCHFVALRPSF